MPTERRRLSMQAMRLFCYAAIMAGDVLAIQIGFFIAEQIRGGDWLSPAGVNLGWMALPIFILIALNNGAYSIRVLESAAESVRRPLFALAATALLIAFASFFTQSGMMISRLAFATALGAAAGGLVLARIAIARLLVARFDGRMRDELLIVDDVMDDAVVAVARRSGSVLNAQASGLLPNLSDPVMLDRLARAIRAHDRVVIACPPERRADWALVLKGTQVIGEILMADSNKIGAIGIGEFNNQDTIIVSRGRLSLTNRLKKRVFDLAIAVPALIILAPLLIIVSILIKLDSPGPVLFRQRRMGQSNSIFEIFKFRSMREDSSDDDGTRSTGRADDRITRIGRFIRKTSIDELPQLINVLQGEMSIVGPRPHALGSTAGDQLFWEINQQYWVRHALKPGITGLAQVRGYRGATHAREDLENRLQSDLEYLNGWRLWRDVTILFATVKVLVHPNAY